MLTTEKVLDNASVMAAMALLGSSDHPGQKFERPIKTFDKATKGSKFVDTSGGFLIGELERLDQTIHLPLNTNTWDRDLDIRTDITVADEVSSYTLSTFGLPAGTPSSALPGDKRSVISTVSTAVPEIAVDTAIVKNPLIPWGQGFAYSMHELASSVQVGRPVDVQKIEALGRDYQMQMDAQAYMGWTGNGTYGLVNSAQVTPTNLPAGASTYTAWSKKTPAEILTDLANMTYIPWVASGFAVRPNRILIDPANFNLISIMPVTTAGSKSILQYFLESYNAEEGVTPLRVLPLKWCIGTGVGGTRLAANSINRAVVYTKTSGDWKQAFVRYPVVPFQRTPVQYDGLFHKGYYWGRLGTTEITYPETVALFDGL
jgi:hypothetical protein